MPAGGLRRLSTIIGVIAGLTELVLAFTAVVTTGKSADYVGMFIYVVPFVIMLGAVLVSYRHEPDLGAGMMVVGFAIQHVLDPIRPIYLLPMVLVAIAVALALRADYDLRHQAAQNAASNESAPAVSST
jgi:hypothetical protein